MDPNACRAKMIETANRVIALDSIEHRDQAAHFQAEAVRLAEAVHDMDEWLRAGGFYPDEWVTSTQKFRVSHLLDQPGREQDVDI